MTSATQATSTSQISGYAAGTWDIDPAHSSVGFSVRHMMLSKVRGQFRDFSGEIVTGPEASSSTVTATVAMSSVDTGNEQRDGHLRTGDFLDVATHPVMTFRSTSVSAVGPDWAFTGDLTVKGVTRQVTFDLEVNGFGPDPFGGTRAGFSGRAEISRKAFGVDLDMPMDGGGVVVGDKVTLELEIEAVLRTAGADAGT